MRNFLTGLFSKLALLVVAAGLIFLLNGGGSKVSEEWLDFAKERLEHFGKRETDVSAQRERNPALSKPDLPQEFVATANASRVRPDLPSHCHDRTFRSGTVVIGDKISIRLFETELMASQASTPEEPKAALERLDFSGVYEVGESGDVAIPLLGRIEILGRSLSCVERIISAAAFDYTPNETMVTASFRERPSVTAIGEVAAPGRYAYQPGMTVEQLLLLAGINLQEAPDASSVSNAPHLEARKTELESALISNEIKHERINAAMMGESDLSMDAIQLAAAERVLGNQRLEYEVTVLAAGLDVLEKELEQLHVDKSQVDRLIQAKQNELEVAEAHLELLSQRHSDLLDLKARGLAKTHALMEAEASRMDMQRLTLQTRSELVELEARAKQLSSSIELKKARNMQQLAGELQSISEEASSLKSQLNAVNLQLAPSLKDRVDARYEIEIERPGAQEKNKFEVMPETIVLPGDVVVTKIVYFTSDGDRYAFTQTDDPLQKRGLE